jgi:hypothetical protein
MSKEKFPVPWEFRLNKFDAIVLKNGNKINYWTVESDNKIMVGFHSAKESYGDIEIGELISDEVSGQKSLFVKDRSNQNIIGQVLPLILKKYIDIEVIRESSLPDRNSSLMN